MTKELLLKFFNDRCTVSELNEVIRWSNTEALNTENKNLALDEWKSFRVEDHPEDDEKFSLLFDKIQQKIAIETFISKNGKPGISRLTIITNWMIRTAAILFIPVLAFLYYTNSERYSGSVKTSDLHVDSLEVIAPIGSRTIVQLSDGSEVHLNYGQDVKYPQVFSEDTREVRLTGEGFFKIASNPEKPFIVKTGKLNVKALGTVFNVFAYSEEENVQTTLIEGKVILEKSAKNGETIPIGAMEPGQHVNYNLKTGAVTSSKGNIEEYVAWIDGKLIFNDTPIMEISEKLSRMYNADITVKADAKDYFYTMTLVDEPLFQILDLISICLSDKI